MNKFLIALTSHLNLIPGIVAAAQALQSIGHSKESTLQKIVESVEITAAVGETIPVPLVQSISGLVENIVTQVFPAATATPNTAVWGTSVPAPTTTAAPSTPATPAAS
jgi:hypothetical protein